MDHIEVIVESEVSYPPLHSTPAQSQEIDIEYIWVSDSNYQKWLLYVIISLQ